MLIVYYRDKKGKIVSHHGGVTQKTLGEWFKKSLMAMM